MNSRSGDAVELIDASVRAVAGTAVSTTLYVLTAIIYAAVTTPQIAGKTLFVVLVVVLAMRPVRGLSQTLHKVGSETAQRVAAYLCIAAVFGVCYVVVLGLGGYVSVGGLSQYTIVEPALFVPALLLAAAKGLGYITQGLLGAIGRPSYITWVTAARDGVIIAVALLLMPYITTARQLLLLFVAARVVVFPPVLVVVRVLPALPTRQELRRAYNYTKWSIPDQLVDIVSYNMPALVLGVVATPFAVGVYEAADRLADFGVMVCYQLAAVLLTKVSGDWSAGRTEFPYLDSAVTGATGVTLAAVGYVLPARHGIAELAFPEAPAVFSTVVVLVGVVNVMRGFWTAVSFVMEGINKPRVSVETKIYGLLVGVPATVILGREFGAVGGAAGYGLMNGVIFVAVVWFSYDQFDRVLVDWALLGWLVLSVIPTAVGTHLVLTVGAATQDPVSVLGVAALMAAGIYTGCLVVLSPTARRVLSSAVQGYPTALLGDE